MSGIFHPVLFDRTRLRSSVLELSIYAFQILIEYTVKQLRPRLQENGILIYPNVVQVLASHSAETPMTEPESGKT